MSFMIRNPVSINYFSSLIDTRLSEASTNINNVISSVVNNIDTKFDSKDNIVLETFNNEIPVEKLSNVRYMNLSFDPLENPNPVIELPELPLTQVFYLINQTEITEEESFFVTINYKGKMLGMLEAEYGIQLLYVKDIDRFFVI
jgi:hypothetical protein